MATRRQIIQAAGGIGLASAVIPQVGHTKAAASLHRVVFDSRYDTSLTFAAEARRLGLITHDTRGDVTGLYADDLMVRWAQGPAAVAGLTPYSQMFSLKLVGETPRLRLVFLQPAASEAGLRLLAGERPEAAVVDQGFAADTLVTWLIAPVRRPIQA